MEKSAIQASSAPGSSKGSTVSDEKRGVVKGSQATTVPTDSIIDEMAEAKLRWKIDLYVIPWVSIIYILCFIDRSNVGNAKLAGLEKDLGMSGNDYNLSITIFYVAYIAFELPLNAICKWIGPGWFIPISCLGFAICTIITAFVHNFSGFCGIRFMLGVFESAIMPASSYYLSRWYRRSELTFRISLFIVAASLSGAFGGLLASAILTMDHVGSVTSWKMIFLVEGIVTAGVAIIAIICMTDSPESARWLTEEEKTLAIERIKSERVGARVVLDNFSHKRFLQGILNPVVVTTSFIFLLDTITVVGIAFFLPTIVATIFPEKTVIEKQLLTVPPYVLGTIMCLIVSYWSMKIDKRAIFLIGCAPISVVAYAMFLGSGNSTVRYAATFLPVCGIYAYGALTNSHVSANVVSDTARSAAIAFNSTIGNLGALVSTWAFLPWDAPMYRIGNGINIAAQSLMFLTAIGLYYWTNADNKKRERRSVEEELAGMSEEEIEQLDWRHPGFRWHN